VERGKERRKTKIKSKKKKKVGKLVGWKGIKTVESGKWNVERKDRKTKDK